MTKNLESRVAELEQAIGTHEPPRFIVVAFVRPGDHFVCGYYSTRTGEHISQSDDEPDEAFMARAAAAGFCRAAS